MELGTTQLELVFISLLNARDLRDILYTICILLPLKMNQNSEKSQKYLLGPHYLMKRYPYQIIQEELFVMHLVSCKHIV